MIATGDGQMKKISILAVCISIIALMAGCAKTAGADKTTESSAKTSDSSSQNGDGDYGARIDELENKVNSLTKLLADAYGVDEDELIDNWEYSDLDLGEIHDIYDDSAVINAYKTGDTSKLTDEKDIFIYESLNAAVKEIIKEDMSDYEKEKAVYDYIFNNSHYDEGNLSAIDLDEGESWSHTPYGFFKNGETICVGNATTFKLFMDALDIDCKIIHCTEDGEHAWNAVKIDGDWYHVDLTFDSGVSEPNYDSFNVNDEIKEQDGYDWSDQEDIPECTSLKYCYSVTEAQEIGDVYEIPSEMKKVFDKGGDNVLMKIAVPEGTDENTVCSDIETLIGAIVCDKNKGYLITDNVFECDGYVYFSLTRVKYDELDGAFDNTEESENGLKIDTDKFSQAMDSLDGYSFNEDMYNDYMSWYD